MNTAKIAGPMMGDKLYQRRAREVLPILVRQAEVGSPISYSDLAKEVGIQNPRNLNYVLGAIGTSLENLSESWNEKVPPINSLVVNKYTKLPGEGVGWFLVKGVDFSLLRPHEKKAIVKASQEGVFEYKKWREVLKLFDLKPITIDYSSIIGEASSFSGGESEEHKALKHFVANNPHIVGLNEVTAKGETERQLPSGDSIDISFEENLIWIGVEVKSVKSGTADIMRGFFQCIKYLSVMKAEIKLKGHKADTRTFLVLEGHLPNDLLHLKNMLGIEVVEGIKPKIK